jgi:hypothetical protein
MTLRPMASATVEVQGLVQGVGVGVVLLVVLAKSRLLVCADRCGLAAGESVITYKSLLNDHSYY